MITITTIEQERMFAEYQRRRGELRDAIAHGVYPNLKFALDLYNRFNIDYAPGGAMHNAELWAYYQSNIAPVAAQMGDMIAAAQTIVDAVEAVERAAPGTFGVQVSSVAETEADPIDPQ